MAAGAGAKVVLKRLGGKSLVTCSALLGVYDWARQVVVPVLSPKTQCKPRRQYANLIGRRGNLVPMTMRFLRYDWLKLTVSGAKLRNRYS